MKMNAWTIGGLLGAIAVMLGAMGAHALKSELEPQQLMSFETAVRYQMYHAIMIFVLGFMNSEGSNRLLRYAHYLFLFGTILFSGSIYLLSTKNVTGLDTIQWLGPVTPIGGTLLITGWLLILFAGLKKVSSPQG